MIIVVNVIMACYLALQLVLGIGASLGWLWEEFWTFQNFFGKVCATLFYIPAYVIGLLKYAVVFLAFWIFSALAYAFQMLVGKVLFKLYKNIKKFDLQGLTNTPICDIIYM